MLIPRPMLTPSLLHQPPQPDCSACSRWDAPLCWGCLIGDAAKCSPGALLRWPHTSIHTHEPFNNIFSRPSRTQMFELICSLPTIGQKCNFINNSSTSFCLRCSSCRTDLSIHFQPSWPTTIWMFFLVTLTLSLVHSTMRQTTEIVKWRSLVDTAVWDFLNWYARFTRDSNPGL